MTAILVLDSALARALAAVVTEGEVVAECAEATPRGHSAQLAPLASRALAQAGIAATALDAIAVTVGPGSFTGLRAALALGHGIAVATGRPIVGVTLAEVFAAGFSPDAGRMLRTAIDSRRGRVFMADAAGPFRAYELAALPPSPGGGCAVAGDAAVAVAAILAARGGDVRLTDLRRPEPRDIAAAAMARLRGVLPPLPALPLYVDPPEAKLPAGGLRPAPAG